MSIYSKFAKYYDMLYREIVDYNQEVEVLEEILGKFSQRKPRTVLDIGCGTGSHAILLSKHGYSITGIDMSPAMIEEAAKKAREEGTGIEFLVQDMRKLELKRIFDCAICMFGGFGYVLVDDDVVQLLSRLGQHLEQDSLFIYEFWNVGGVRETPYKTWLRIQDEELTLYRLSESNFDPQTNTLKIDFHFIELSKNAVANTFDEAHVVRCYTLAEMRKYLGEHGFEYVAAYDWNIKNEREFQTPRKDSFRILMVAKRSRLN